MVGETATHPYLVTNQQASCSDYDTAFKTLAQVDELALPVAFSKLLDQLTGF